MSYEPTNWQAGDIVTSAKLNKLEQGVANGGGILIVHSDENGILDKTWQEIYDAELAFQQEIDNDYKSIYLISQIGVEDNTYYIQFASFSYTTSSPDDYPVFNQGGGLK